MTDARDLLDHVVRTIRYRAGNSLQDAPASFANARVGDGHWDALHTVSHMNDVLAWCLSILKDDEAWETAEPESLESETKRFNDLLESISTQLRSDEAIEVDMKRILQGPLADVLTHTGQLATLRRLAGKPVTPENYFAATI
ncbi:MAG: hypothetical protein AAF581_14690 [Planctomycetota bacterium]